MEFSQQGYQAEEQGRQSMVNMGNKQNTVNTSNRLNVKACSKENGQETSHVRTGKNYQKYTFTVHSIYGTLFLRQITQQEKSFEQVMVPVHWWRKKISSVH